MPHSPKIEISTNPARVTVNGLAIHTAPTVDEFHAVLGTPSRIDGIGAAPFGHRNNQIHVYDDLGLRFIEHHFTCRAQDITCSFTSGDEGLFRFTPKLPFVGDIFVNGKQMPLGGIEAEFFLSWPFQFDRRLPGIAICEFGGFSVAVQTRGSRLRSGRKSKTRHVVEISFGWPHDNWSEPSP
jgi:hypothetical protein